MRLNQDDLDAIESQEKLRDFSQQNPLVFDLVADARRYAARCRTCEICHARFPQRDIRHRFCSSRCGDAHDLAEKRRAKNAAPLLSRECECCKISFTARNVNQRFCVRVECKKERAGKSVLPRHKRLLPEPKPAKIAIKCERCPTLFTRRDARQTRCAVCQHAKKVATTASWRAAKLAENPRQTRANPPVERKIKFPPPKSENQKTVRSRRATSTASPAPVPQLPAVAAPRPNWHHFEQPRAEVKQASAAKIVGGKLVIGHTPRGEFWETPPARGNCIIGGEVSPPKNSYGARRCG